VPSGTRRQETIEKPVEKARPKVPIDIPSNLETLSAKELMAILDSIGIKRDDCFEKADLIKRIEEF
jgi:NAD(P)H-hydrate repair Nnr-like enzyme with NAD(P)H-hydrate epimerase domain